MQKLVFMRSPFFKIILHQLNIGRSYVLSISIFQNHDLGLIAAPVYGMLYVEENIGSKRRCFNGIHYSPKTTQHHIRLSTPKTDGAIVLSLRECAFLG